MHLCEERPGKPLPGTDFHLFKMSTKIFIKCVTYKFITSVRLNFLAKDSNPNYKNGKSEWRKNNTLGTVYFSIF